MIMNVVNDIDDDPRRALPFSNLRLGSPSRFGHPPSTVTSSSSLSFPQFTFNTMDGDLLRIWQLVHDLSEQLAHNQKLTATLQAQANSLKVRVDAMFRSLS